MTCVKKQKCTNSVPQPVFLCLEACLPPPLICLVQEFNTFDLCGTCLQYHPKSYVFTNLQNNILSSCPMLCFDTTSEELICLALDANFAIDECATDGNFIVFENCTASEMWLFLLHQTSVLFPHRVYTLLEKYKEPPLYGVGHAHGTSIVIGRPCFYLPSKPPNIGIGVPLSSRTIILESKLI